MSAETLLADDSLARVLDLVRSGAAVTRPEIGRAAGLGRHVVTQRVADLVATGLVVEPTLGASTGGRAPRELRLASDAGCVLVADLGATELSVAVTDLDGRVLSEHHEPTDVGRGPRAVLATVCERFDDLAASQSSPVWGIGLGLPGPVEWSSGHAVSPPIMPGWDRYPVRDHLSERYRVPVWVDNDVNVMALGELRRGLGHGLAHMIYVKVGTGIGAGLISNGSLHRGAQGTAGDIGHVSVGGAGAARDVVCRCGRRGCLEAVAGGAAIARDGARAAVDGSSPYLADVLARGDAVDVEGVVAGAAHGDAACVDVLTASGELVGEILARMVNMFNPSLIVLGGRVSAAGDPYLATVRRCVLERSLPLATADLTIAISRLGEQAGLRGAASMVVDELFSRRHLRAWIEAGSPVGLPHLTGA